MHSDSIVVILQKIQQGSRIAAEQLYAEFQPIVLRVVRRHLSRSMRRLADSVDFSQMVWKTIFEHATELLDLESPEQIAAYIAVVATNKVHSDARAQLTLKRDIRRLDSQSLSADFPVHTRDPSPSQAAMANERYEALCTDLNPVQKQMIQQRLEGYNLDEIARNLQVNERTVRRVIQRLSDTQEK